MSEDTRPESQPESQTQFSSPIRRVVVALDASPCSRVVLRSAARISAALGAPLEGLFVEDVRLLDLAELPIATELRQPGGIRSFDRDVAERELRVVAQTVNRWAGQIAGEYNLAWHFRVIRGGIASTLMEAGGEGTLLSLGRFGNSIYSRPSRMGSVAQRVLGEHSAPLLLLHQEIRPGQPIRLVTSGAADELPLVALAVRLAQVYTSPLAVFADNPSAEAFLRVALDESPLPVSFHRLRSGDLSRQILAAGQGTGGLVLSHRRDHSLAELDCAVILL